MTLNYPKKENGLYCIRRDQLDEIAGAVLSEYAPEVLVKPQPLRIGDIAQEQLGLTLQYQNLSPNGEISGLVSFGDTKFDCYDDLFRPIELSIADGTILIDKSLSNDRLYPRRRYTITHEFSHRLLHRSYRDPSRSQFNFRKNRNPLIACRSSDIERSNEPRSINSDSEWEEWQADGLAAALLMPRSTFSKLAIDYIRSRTDRQFMPRNIQKDVFNEIVTRLSNVFVVSRQATIIRLKVLNLVSNDISA